MGIDHQQMQLFFAVFMMNGGDEHTEGINAHQRAGRQVREALFKKFCKRDFCDEVRDFKIPEPEAVAS